jgi:hypothetical protein
MPTHIRRLTNRLSEADNRSRKRCSGCAKPTRATGSLGSDVACQIESEVIHVKLSSKDANVCRTANSLMSREPMRDRTDSKQNPYIAGSRLAVENNRLLSTGSNLPQDPAFTGIFCWRRGRDSNPRWAFDPYALSRGAPSTTRPPLRSGNEDLHGARDDTRAEPSR